MADIPNFAELLGPFIERIPEANRPAFLAALERGAAQRYRDWAEAAPEHAEGLFALLEMNPQVRPARTPGGALQWRIQGNFAGRVRMVPSGRVNMEGVDD